MYLALHAAGARLCAFRLRADDLRGRADRARAGHGHAAGRHRHLPAHVHPVGPAGLREGLQLLRAEGRCRRKGEDLPVGRRRVPRLLQVLGRGRSRPRPAAEVCGGGQAGAAQDPCGARRPGGVRHFRWRSLGDRLNHFFRGVGLRVLEGYGLTETTAPVGVNVPDRNKIGTVGPALPGIQLRIADDGEILAKGIAVFQRYHNNDAATAESLTDGWFHTGDLGEIDAAGYLTITGRKKEIIVTAGGKNVIPSQAEDRIRSHTLVSQCVVVGDQRPFVAALLTLDEEMLPGWLSNQGLPQMSVAEAATHPQVLQALQEALDRANKYVSRAESVRRFEILPEDFTFDDYLTPKLSVKRNLVLRDFAATIDDLYAKAAAERASERASGQ